YPVNASSAYSKTMSAMGLRSQAILLGRCRRPALPDEINDLALDPQEVMIEVETVRLLDEQPIRVLRHRLAARPEDLLQWYAGGSMRQYLAAKDIKLKRVSTLIGARAPTQRDAMQLLMPRHTPVLSIRTLSSDMSGKPFELACSITRADRFKYHVISGEQHED